MISEDMISNLLHQHTPEPTTVLQAEALMSARGRARGIDTRSAARTPRRFAVPHFAGAVIGVAVVAGVVAASLVVTNRREITTHETRSGAAASSASSTNPASPATPIEGYSGIGPTWLPPGTATVGVSSVGLGARAGRVEYREYTIRSGSRTALLQIDLASGTSLPTGPSQGVPWRDLTIGGHPARQWSGATWNSVKILRGRSVVTVDFRSSHTSAATLRNWARHIAAGLRYDRHELVPAVFGLGPLAGGLHPAEVSAGTATAPVAGRPVTFATTSYVLSRTGAVDNVMVTLFPHRPRNPGTRAGRPVHGRATATSDRGGSPALQLISAVGGQDISIFAEFPGPRGATLAQLYTIADGLVLPS